MASSVGEVGTSIVSGGLIPEGKLGLIPREGLEGVGVASSRPEPGEASVETPRAGDAHERISRENPKKVGLCNILVSAVRAY